MENLELKDEYQEHNVKEEVEEEEIISSDLHQEEMDQNVSVKKEESEDDLSLIFEIPQPIKEYQGPKQDQLSLDDATPNYTTSFKCFECNFVTNAKAEALQHIQAAHKNEEVNDFSSEPNAVSETVNDNSTESICDVKAEPVNNVTTESSNDVCNQLVIDMKTEPDNDINTEPVKNNVNKKTVDDVITESVPVNNVSFEPSNCIVTELVIDMTAGPDNVKIVTPDMATTSKITVKLLKNAVSHPVLKTTPKEDNIAIPTKMTMFKCASCQFVTTHKKWMEEHSTLKHSKSISLSKGETVSNHDAKSIYKCSLCDLTSEDQQNIIDHLQTFHDKTNSSQEMLQVFPLKCSKCDFVIRLKEAMVTVEDQQRLAEHLQTHNSKETPKTSFKDQFEKYWKMKHKKRTMIKLPVKKFKCSMCHFKIDSTPESQEEIDKHLDECIKKGNTMITFKCSICYFNSENKERVLQHFQVIHTGKTQCKRKVREMPQKCEGKMPKPLCKRNAREMPQESKGQMKNFHCGLCSKSFNDMSSLEWHWQFHKNKDNKYKCNSCPSSFRSLKDMQFHLGLLSQPFQKCPHCPYESKNPEEFSLHVSTHETEMLNCAGEIEDNLIKCEEISEDPLTIEIESHELEIKTEEVG